MDYILEEYGENLLGYFELLRNVGGSHRCEPYRFLIAGFIDEILNSGMSLFVTEEDYKCIDRLLNCVMGTCLMPFHKWKGGAELNYKSLLDGGTVISTEDSEYLLAPDAYSQVYRTE